MGIFVGLLFACCFYAFLYVCREALRILFFMTEDYDVLVLSNATVHFCNFILAYIATVLGQSLCFVCWFEIPLRKLGKYASQMRAVINDQRSMNSYFLSWFSRLAYVFALLIGGTMGGGIYVIRTFSDYKYVLLLVIFVLFLHTWQQNADIVSVVFGQRPLKVPTTCSHRCPEIYDGWHSPEVYLRKVFL